ncbi:hypothetical protein AM501_06635 [Aneurinibacillus migulanus]|uniref:helix-turn-helix transcriptional regulator n=1 Tax=Aneurinibacillus migulanus TaxID=47500 RepID=UPI0005BB95EE|nr:helix-turn-helix transcriptional regulator [Aneurinibacillus migulanus]KIV55269.1 hypothetical protein TS64_12030 [Aneurinibacillus migulanus]KPD09029.1 hypothetical protein AM501_06635 [Aneurinibacillus migulanus]
MQTITLEQFKAIRSVYHLTQAEMAALLSVHESLINHIENGRRNISARVGRILIDEFELTAEKLQRILQIHKEFSVR